MLREDFINEMVSFSDLCIFCDDERLSFCEDLMSEDVFYDWVENNLVEWARGETWTDLRDRLNHYDDISGNDYYIWDDYEDEYRPAADDDFDEIKQSILEYMDEEGRWDDYGEDDEEDTDEQDDGEPDADSEDEPEFDTDGCSIGDLVEAGQSCIRVIHEEELELARQQNKILSEIVITLKKGD